MIPLSNPSPGTGGTPTADGGAAGGRYRQAGRRRCFAGSRWGDRTHWALQTNRFRYPRFPARDLLATLDSRLGSSSGGGRAPSGRRAAEGRRRADETAAAAPLEWLCRQGSVRRCTKRWRRARSRRACAQQAQNAPFIRQIDGRTTGGLRGDAGAELAEGSRGRLRRTDRRLMNSICCASTG